MRSKGALKTSYIAIAVIVIIVIAAIAIYFTTMPKPTPTTPTPTTLTTPTPTPATTPTVTTTPVGPPIKIAFIPPLTGPAARTGKEFKDAIEFTYAELKAKGKIPVLVDGKLRDIELIWLDSKSDPAEAVKAYEDAIVRLGVDILGWNWHSSVAMALYKISTKYGKIHFGDVGETQFLCYERIKNPAESKYWFKSWPCPPLYGSLFVPAFEEVIKDIGYTLRNKKVALIVEDTDYGRGMGDALKTAFEKYGWTVVYYDVFTLSPPETEFTPFISKYKDADVSLVYIVSTSLPSMNAFLKQAYEMKLKAFKGVFGIGWFSPDEWYPTLKEASDYVLSMDGCVALTKEQKDWLAKFKEKYGYEPSVVVSGYWAHDNFCMLIEGLWKAGTLNPDKLRDTLLEMDYRGLFMGIKFNKEVETPGPTGTVHYMEVFVDKDHFFFPLLQWKGGKSVVIWPKEYATAKLEIPPELK